MPPPPGLPTTLGQSARRLDGSRRPGTRRGAEPASIAPLGEGLGAGARFFELRRRGLLVDPRRLVAAGLAGDTARGELALLLLLLVDLPAQRATDERERLSGAGRALEDADAALVEAGSESCASINESCSAYGGKGKSYGWAVAASKSTRAFFAVIMDAVGGVSMCVLRG